MYNTRKDGNMSMSCTRRLEWDAGHRVLGHKGKCQHPHGHRYVVEITAEPYGGINDLGMVLDFSILKQVYGEFIDREWDHGFLVNKDDFELIAALNMITNAKVYQCPFNPTAENLSWFLLTHTPLVQALAQHKVVVRQVKLYETPNCFAVAKV